VWEDFADETSSKNLENGHYFSLTDSGTINLAAFGQGVPVPAVQQALLAPVRVEPAALADAIRRSPARCSEHGLLVSATESDAVRGSEEPAVRKAVFCPGAREMHSEHAGPDAPGFPSTKSTSQDGPTLSRRERRASPVARCQAAAEPRRPPAPAATGSEAPMPVPPCERGHGREEGEAFLERRSIAFVPRTWPETEIIVRRRALSTEPERLASAYCRRTRNARLQNSRGFAGAWNRGHPAPGRE